MGNFETGLAQKKKIQQTDISNLKRFEKIELKEKLLNCFLGSNKSNINQSACRKRLKI